MSAASGGRAHARDTSQDVILRRVAFRESSGATPGETKAGEADAEQRERGVAV